MSLQEEMTVAQKPGVVSPPAWLAGLLWLRRAPRYTLAVGRERLWALLCLRGCTKVGAGVRLKGRPLIQNWGVITIGDRTRIHSTTVRSEFASYRRGRLEIGSNVYLNYGASIAAHLLVRIGNGCTIGTYAILMDNDFHGVEQRHRTPPSQPIVLEENVWLGARVIVLKGVTIGHDSVIGAGSVVTKDIPPRCVAAGVPARILRNF